MADTIAASMANQELHNEVHDRVVGIHQGLHHAGGVCEGLGCGECSGAGVLSALVFGLQHEGCHRADGEQDDDHDLQNEHLARDATRAEQGVKLSAE